MVGKNMMIGWELGIDRNAQLPKLAMDAALDDIMLPKISPESALNIGGCMATGSGTLNNYYTTNNGGSQSDNSEVVGLLKKLVNKDTVLVVKEDVLAKVVDRRQANNLALRNYQVE